MQDTSDALFQERVPRDYKIAVKWYTLAAKQGYARAQTRLGLVYDMGKDVFQDYVLAHMSYNIAVSNGNKTSIFNRDLLAKQMTPSQLEEAQDLARECVRKKYKRC